MSEKKVLLIWDESPDSIRYFLLPESVAEENLKHLTDAHGHYINVDDTNDGMAFLSTAVIDPKYAYEGLPFKERVGCFREHEWADPHHAPLLNANISAVYISGFLP